MLESSSGEDEEEQELLDSSRVIRHERTIKKIGEKKYVCFFPYYLQR